MKRITFVLLYALLAATTAPAQVWRTTNAASGVISPLLYTNFVAGQFRVTVTALDGDSLPLDLSSDRVSLQVEDHRDGKLVVSNTCTALDVATYRGEGVLTASPSTNTLKIIVYPAANPSAFYPIYWASVAITSTPSAAVNITVPTASLSLVPLIASNGALGTVMYPWQEINAITGRFGSLSVNALDVEGEITALDTGAVRRTGDTLSGALTNESGFYGSFVGNGAGLTNLPPASVATLNDVGDVDTAPSTGDLLSWDGAKWTNLPPSDSGGYIGTVQLVTNASQQVGYTNSAGYFTALPGFALPGGNGGGWLYISDYSTDTIVSNRNIGGITYFVTNGTVAGLLPNETAGLRMVDYRAVPAGVNLRAAVEWVQRPQRGKAATAGTIRNGLAWTTTANNTSYLWGAQAAGNVEPLWKQKQYASNFGLQGDIFGNAPYDALLQSFLLSEFPQATWDLIDWDTNGIVRGYVASPDVQVPTLLHLMTNAAFGQAIAGFAIGFNSDSAATARGTNVPWQVRRFLIGEGLWIDQSYR